LLGLGRVGANRTGDEADDDADDRLMILEAFEESRVANRLDFVVDGEQLLQYLRREGEFGRLEAEPA
jgi:two-component system response regulator